MIPLSVYLKARKMNNNQKYSGRITMILCESAQKEEEGKLECKSLKQIDKSKKIKIKCE